MIKAVKICKRKFILPKTRIPVRRRQFVCLKDSDSGDFKDGLGNTRGS